MDVIELTKEGLEKVQAELKQLNEVEMPKIAEQIAVARSYGDLSENADYSAARDKQAEIAARIAELQNIVDNHKIIDSRGSSENVLMGSIVTLDNGKKFKMVGTVEVDPLNDSTDYVTISNESPLGKAIFGKKVGDTARVDCKNPYTVKIKKIEGSR